MNIAVLAVQGAFIEHEYMLEKLGVNCIELRKSTDIKDSFDGIVLPGGESTVQSKLLKDLNMFESIKAMIENDVPVLATCAGMILLAEEISGTKDGYFKTLPITVKRNAYGRQLGSFSDVGIVKMIKDCDRAFPLEFIRAPYIESINSMDVEIITTIDKLPPNELATKLYDASSFEKGKNIVGVRYRKQLAYTCHPELTQDLRIHEAFVEMCK